VPECYKVEQCYVTGDAAPKPFAVVKNCGVKDCCKACDAKNGTGGEQQCAIGVFSSPKNGTAAAGAGGAATGTCSLYTKDALPSRAVNTGGGHSTCFLPSRNNPPPHPIIMGSAAIVVGDMKLVAGRTIHMAIFTGPHYPNATTPDTDETEEVRPGEWGGGYKVPTFDCSTPTKPLGCLFNLTADPTEHVDLAEAMPDVAAQLFARLHSVSATYFDPDRGSVQQAGCRQMEGPNRGFFGPWLELGPDHMTQSRRV